VNRTTDKDQSDRVQGKCIGSCDKCGINLGVKRFKIFHTIGNVPKLRSKVKSHGKKWKKKTIMHRDVSLETTAQTP